MATAAIPSIKIRSRLSLESCAVADEKMMKARAPIDVAIDHDRRCASSLQSCPSRSNVRVPVIISQTPMRNMEVESMKIFAETPKRMTPNNPMIEIKGRKLFVVNFEGTNDGVNPPMIKPTPNKLSILLDIVAVIPICLMATNGSYRIAGTWPTCIIAKPKTMTSMSRFDTVLPDLVCPF